MLEVKNLSYTYPGRAEAALSGVNLVLEPGQCICLAGPSGCGKSTLLKAVEGLLNGPGLGGRVRLSPPGLKAGMVFQNVDTQLLATVVSDEIGFAPQNLGLSRAGIASRTRAALAAVGLSGLERRNVEMLSDGQKQRVCLAAVLAMEPGLLLLDEPLAQLDQTGRTALVETLARLKAAGHGLLISEHNLAPLAGLADAYGLFDQSGQWLGLDSTPPGLPGPSTFHSSGPALGQETVVHGQGLVLSGPGGPVLNGLDLELEAGRRVHLFGTNGAGKSSLLACLAGLIRLREGRLVVTGRTSPQPEDLVGRVGYLFQNPQRQLFEETVEAEVGFTLRRLGLGKKEVAARAARALELCRADHLAARPPLALSWGEQHRVALASVLALKPRLLLCYEPLAGLDWQQRFELLAVLDRLAVDEGATVVIASHDPLPGSGWPDLSLVLDSGKVRHA